jgi:hypothetical protein
MLSFYAGTLDFNTLVQRLASDSTPEFQTAVASSFWVFLH